MLNIKYSGNWNQTSLSYFSLKKPKQFSNKKIWIRFYINKEYENRRWKSERRRSHSLSCFAGQRKGWESRSGRFERSVTSYSKKYLNGGLKSTKRMGQFFLKGWITYVDGLPEDIFRQVFEPNFFSIIEFVEERMNQI